MLKDFRAFMVVLCLALVARGAAMAVFHGQLHKDTDDYALLAEHLVNMECYCLYPDHPTAFRPPLYPLLLAPWSLGGPPSAVGIVILHLTLAALTVIGVYVVGLQWCDQRGAMAAGVLTALDPLLIYQSAQVMTETLAAAMVVLVLLLLTRLYVTPSVRAAILAGIAVGLSVLGRPTFLFWVPLVVIGVLLMKERPLKKRFQFAALIIGFCVLTLMPWIVRNWLVLGRPVVATTHGGYTLWLANNDSFYDYLQDEHRSEPWSAGAIDEQQRSILRDAKYDEVVADSRYQQMAREAIQRRPALFAYSCTYRIGSLWHPLPARRGGDESWYESALRIATAVWYLMFYGAVIVGLLQLRLKILAVPWWWALSLLLAFTLVHTFYWTDIRMRAPLVPALALFAGFFFGAVKSFRSFRSFRSFLDPDERT